MIIPAHHAAATLGAALDSVRAQSFSDYEVIVVDDGVDDWKFDPTDMELLAHHMAQLTTRDLHPLPLQAAGFLKSAAQSLLMAKA